MKSHTDIVKYGWQINHIALFLLRFNEEKKKKFVAILHRQPTVTDNIELLNRTLLLPAHSIIPCPWWTRCLSIKTGKKNRPG